MSASCKPRVQLFADAGNGWPHSALRYIISSCQSAAISEIVKRFWSRPHVRSAITTIATLSRLLNLTLSVMSVGVVIRSMSSSTFVADSQHSSSTSSSSSSCSSDRPSSADAASQHDQAASADDDPLSAPAADTRPAVTGPPAADRLTDGGDRRTGATVGTVDDDALVPTPPRKTWNTNGVCGSGHGGPHGGTESPPYQLGGLGERGGVVGGAPATTGTGATTTTTTTLTSLLSRSGGGGGLHRRLHAVVRDRIVFFTRRDHRFKTSSAAPS